MKKTARKKKRTKRRKRLLWFLLTSWATVRLLSVFLLWWNVLIGCIINILFDTIDGDIIYKLGVNRDYYQHYDKKLDFWLYVFLLIYALQHFEKDFVFVWLVAAWFFRLVGEIFYELTNYEQLFVAFPNVFISIFLFKAILPGFFYSKQLGFPLFYASIPIITILTIYKEWLLHIKKFPIGETIFKKIGIYK